MPLRPVPMRCPIPPVSEKRGALLGVLLTGNRPPLVEITCSSCLRAARARGENVNRVVHRYDAGSGAPVDTVIS